MDKTGVQKFFESNPVAMVKFKKKNGEVRTIKAMVKPTQTVKFQEPNNGITGIDVFTVWDVEGKGFKSFYPSNVIEMTSDK